jgi:thioredoxin reductase
VTLDVVVIGGGPAGLSAATWLARYRRTVAVLDSRECRNRWADARHGVTVREETAVELVGARGDLRAVRLAGGDTVECELGFSIAYHPVTGLGEQLGCERDPGGYLVVDASGTTPSPASSPPVTSPSACNSSRAPPARRHRRRRLRPLSGKRSNDPTAASSRRRGRGRGRT